MLRSRIVSVPASTSGIFLANDVLPRLGLAGRVELKSMPRGSRRRRWWQRAKPTLP